MKRAIVFSIVFLLGAAFALAGAQVDNFVNETAYTGTAAQGENVTAGNIYGINFTVEEQTYRWVAFYGNLTGTIVLRDAAGNTFYSWNAQAAGSVIYARTENTVPAIASLAAVSDATTVDTAYGFPNDASDNVASTYTQTVNFASPSGVSVTNTLGVYLNGTAWTNYLLSDGQGSNEGQYLWAVIATDAQHAYNGKMANYELLVPEDGQAGDTTGTAYYFWVELK